MASDCYTCKWLTWLDGSHYIGVCCGKHGITIFNDNLEKISIAERSKLIVDNGLRDNCSEWEASKQYTTKK